MLRKSYPFVLLLAVLAFTIAGCQKDAVVPEVKESYRLEIDPDALLFPALGGEATVEITATKYMATISNGDTIEYIENPVPYTVTISGKGFSIEGRTVSAEINSVNYARKGVLTVKIDGSTVGKSVYLTQEGAEESEENGTEVTKVRILAIGNSFSEDALEYHLHGLAHANADTIIVGNLYFGSRSLEVHYNNTKNNSSDYSYRKIVNGQKTTTPSYAILNAIKDEAWDYISFQQVSSTSGMYATYLPYIENLIEYARGHALNPNVKFILHATWAYAQNSTHSGFAAYGKNQMIMYDAIVDATRRVAEETGIDLLIPAGTAIQNGRSSSLGDTFCRDGYHLETSYGRYTASCTWYESLFKKSVVGNGYIPSTMSAFQAKVAQYAAHHAVKNPYKVTSLSDLVDDTPN